MTTIAVASALPSSEPASATIAPCSRNTRWMRPRVVPIARRMPISRRFCTTETTSTLAMPSTTTMATKIRIVRVVIVWALSAASSWSLVFIHESAVSPVSRAIRCATASAANRSATLTSSCDAPPGRSNSACAVRSPRNTVRRFMSRMPRSTRPVTV